jgi:SprT-like family
MRNLGLVLFLVTVVSLGALHALPKKTPHTYELPLNPAALYQSDNELYFDGKLPQATVIGEEPDGERDAGHVWVATTLHAVGSHYYKIQISPRYNPFVQDEELSVLHEMCHTWVWEQAESRGEAYDDGHGKTWQSCMESLAAKHAFRDIW